MARAVPTPLPAGSSISSDCRSFMSRSEPRNDLRRELGPVVRDSRVIVDPAARVCHCQCHRGKTLRSRHHDDHRVLAPGSVTVRQPTATLQVDNPLAMPVRRNGCTDLIARRSFARTPCAPPRTREQPYPPQLSLSSLDCPIRHEPPVPRVVHWPTPHSPAALSVYCPSYSRSALGRTWVTPFPAAGNPTRIALITSSRDAPSSFACAT
jgi:hypothetical protein